jgi:predicted AAA+ superfamily ATPase
MFEDEIQRKIADFKELGIPPYIPRENRVPFVNEMITAIIGARRTGKSYRALQAADEFIKSGFIKSAANICRIDFDNPILSQMKSSDLSLIKKIFLKVNPEFDLKTKLIFVLDEIHRIGGWEEYAIDLSRNQNWKVIITGSSSEMLKDGISSSLRGKSLSSVVYPLSFSEYLSFLGFALDRESTKGQAELRRHFDEYLKWGAYPAIANLDEFSRESVIREYFDTMLLKDIIQRFNVSRPKQCSMLYSYLLSNMARPYTLQAAYKFLVSSEYKTSRDNLRNYVHWAEDAWLLFTVPVMSSSRKEQERNYKKVYCIDWALSMRNSTVWDGSYSRALENMIYLHLRRNFPRVFFYITKTGRKEIDFIPLDSSGKPHSCIQVCQDISSKETLERELEPLFVTAKYFGTSENYIITLNQEKEFSDGKVKVRAIPAFKWLLANPGTV